MRLQTLDSFGVLENDRYLCAEGNMPPNSGASRHRGTSTTAKRGEVESYLLEIIGLETDYSFSSDPSKRLGVNGLVEHQHFTIRARMLRPKRLSAREIAMIIIGSRELDRLLDTPDMSELNDGVGTLTLRSHHSTFLSSLPSRALWGLLPAIGTRSVRYIVLTGPPPRYGKTKIGSIRFRSTYDPEDYND